MKKVIIVINNCNACSFFDNRYWDYNEYCKKLKRRISKMNSVYNFWPIPEDCPLENCNE